MDHLAIVVIKIYESSFSNFLIMPTPDYISETY